MKLPGIILTFALSSFAGVRVCYGYAINAQYNNDIYVLSCNFTHELTTLMYTITIFEIILSRCMTYCDQAVFSTLYYNINISYIITYTQKLFVNYKYKCVVNSDITSILIKVMCRFNTDND